MNKTSTNPVIVSAFRKAGISLAKLIVGVLADAKSDRHVEIICQGSVWKAWKLIRESFVAELKTSRIAAKYVKLVQLVGDGGMDVLQINNLAIFVK